MRSSEVLSFWALNVSAAFLLSAAHNALYFVADIRMPIIHFLHYAVTAIALSLFGTCPSPSSSQVSLRSSVSELAVPVAVGFVECMLSCMVHGGNRTGSLYTVRIFDFLCTVSAVSFGRRWLGRSQYEDGSWPTLQVLCPLALSASLSWLEFGQLEYTTMSLLLAPVLAIVRGIHLVLLQHYYTASSFSSFDQFARRYSQLVAIVLLPFALISFLSRHVEMTASWESIDYTLMGLSFFFMFSYKYSELWLLTHQDVRVFQLLEHTKFEIASYGQWFLQNMAAPSIVALGGKILFIGAAARLLGEYRSSSSSSSRTARKVAKSSTDTQGLLSKPTD